MANSDPRVSVIICSRNRPSLLFEAARSVLAGSVVPADLVIVDQSDVPDSYFAASPPPIRYIHDPRRGLCAARNLSISASSTELLAFTDDDVLVAENWLAKLLFAYGKENRPMVFTGRVLPWVTCGEAGFVPPPKKCDVEQIFRGRQRTDPLTSFNMLLPRSALEQVGGFDERLGPGTAFPAGEDNELAHRLLSSGWCIKTVPAAVVYHRDWRHPREYVSLQWQYGRGHGAFYSKHASAELFMLRRLAGTVANTTGGALRRLFGAAEANGSRLSRRQRVWGELAFAAGVAAGFVQWRVHQALQRDYSP